MPEMLEVSGLEVRFGEVPALRGLDLSVRAGEVLAVLGRNGAGKTSTLRAIAGSVDLAGGAITFEGRDVTNVGAERRVRAGIVLVPEARRLFAHLTVRENLAVGAYHRRLRGRALSDEIDRVIEPLDTLRSRLDQRAGTLSGGEQQLAAIARALMAAPKLLLIDEPSLGLAPIMVDRVYQLLRHLNADGLTIVVVEQYVEVALALAQHGIVIDKGRAVLARSAQELASSHELVDVYLSTHEEAHS